MAQVTGCAQPPWAPGCTSRPQRTAQCRTLIERFADGGTGADCAPPVASLSVLREIAIFVQRRFVNLFTDKRIYTLGSGARARVGTVGGPLLYQ